MKNYGIKQQILLDDQARTQIIMIKNIKMKFKSDDSLPLNKTLELCNMIIVLRYVCHEINKY